MFSLKYLLAAAAVVVAAAVPVPKPRSLTLKEMMNNTVCAIEVISDINHDRIPARIKIIKCLGNTDHWCKENNIKEQDCCQSTQHGTKMECVEMTDTVAVYNKKKKKMEEMTVPVGCACMISHSTVAPKLPYT